DYYTMFIKSWIPFNAWYMKDFYDESSTPKRTSDRSIIDFLNANSNKYRDKIKSLLRGTDVASKDFLELLAKLHYELESHPIPDYDNRISFLTVSLSRNTLKTYSQSVGRFTYFVEFQDQLPKTQKRWFLEIQKKVNNQTLNRVELFEWSLEELNNDPDFISIIEQDQKNKLRDTFLNINPKKPIDVVIKPKRNRNGNFSQPNDSIIIDETNHLYFTDDYDLVSKVIVQLIYDLRCKLFHGELDPIEANLGVYENAYKIQKILIKELRA
ncbi:MAG: hypothetical protein RIB63_00270, partial [Fulvivirga sp.]